MSHNRDSRLSIWSETSATGRGAERMASPGATPGRSRGITPYAGGTRPHTRRRSCMAAMHAMRRDAARAVQSPRAPVHAARLLICSSPPCSAGSEQPASWAPSRTGMQKTWWPWTCRARRALRRQRLRAPGPRNRCGRLRQGAGCTPPVLPAAKGAPRTPLLRKSRDKTRFCLHSAAHRSPRVLSRKG